MQGIKIQFLALALFIQLAYHQSAASTDEDGNLFYYHQSEYPKDCKEILSQCSEPGEIKNGVYIIKPEGLPEPIEVYCDQTTDNGGWTVIQRRIDGSIDFNRDFDKYKDGFGFLNMEHWLGNNYTAHITNQEQYVLRIDMLDNTNSKNALNVTYDFFRLSDDEGLYKLKLEGFTSVGDRATTDRMLEQDDLDFTSGNACGGNGGWWHNTARCSTTSSLNNAYTNLQWGTTGLSHVEMKVRPFNM